MCSFCDMRAKKTQKQPVNTRMNSVFPQAFFQFFFLSYYIKGATRRMRRPSFFPIQL